ncbi:MAG: hypothetical protein H7X95_12550 [Deltaproteobacteria bacterium]|nr:hypothetical protein [Deltaproteobacteria bacterium]
MALTLPWLVAAVVSAMGEVVWTPNPRLAESVVTRVANETAAVLAARRGVRLTRPLVVRLVDRPQMRIARAVPPPLGSRELMAQLFGHLGLASDGKRPAGTRSAGTRSDSPRDDVPTGLYDLGHDRVLIANWSDLAQGRFAVARDVALALLDRRFDLGRWFQAPRPKVDVTFDAVLARHALAHGDATTQALEHVDPEGDLPPPRALSGILEQVRASILAAHADTPPLELQRRLFIELDGLAFVHGVRARSPWTTVDNLWRRPPASTEQILHPQKYDKSDRPDDVCARLPDFARDRQDPSLIPPNDNGQVVHRDVLGELGVRLFLARAGNDYRAERAAMGWGGDCALLLRTSTSAAGTPLGAPGTSTPTFAAWITTWDDDTDAADFATEATRALATLADVPPTDPRLDHRIDPRGASGRVRLTDARGRLFALDHKGRTVGLVIAAPPDAEKLLERLMTSALAAATRPRRSADQARVRPK